MQTMGTWHFNGLGESELERLALLFEDCSEVIHIAGKIIRHGFESTDPTKAGHITNRILLQEEIGQLLWAVEYMVKQGDLYQPAIDKAKQGRKEQVIKYLHHYSI